jgi:pimeloyl-ACP methyl ester carboxylesterase
LSSCTSTYPAEHVGCRWLGCDPNPPRASSDKLSRRARLQEVPGADYKIGPWPAVALATIALFASGCATPVGVSRLDEQAAHRKLNANVLSAGTPSAYSTQILERTALSQRYEEEPEAVLAQLNSGLGKPDERDRLFALSELSFTHAAASHDQSYYLASAVYAYAFLFPVDPAGAPGQYDPRLRLAVDLYNRGIALGLATEDGKEVDLSERELSLPFGSLSLAANPTGFNYAGNHLTKFVPLADLKVRGLRNTYRKAGIGATLSAGIEPAPNNPASRWISSTAKVPITAFVRFDDPRRAMSDGRLNGTVELYDEDRTTAVQVGSYSVPLESDPSAALAYRLEGSPVWDFEIAGFRRGDFGSLGFGNNGDDFSGLFVLHPYHPNMIPVVLVHGTASSPARWAEMANELLGDPAIRSRYQIWGFVYNSGNPIALSAMRLRESLKAFRKDIDPEGKDPALDQMVVIGHSQGGLLTKMTVVDSGTRFWNNFSKVPFDKADLNPETRDLLARALFVEPLPFVKRVIFIATPHRGSFLASNPIAKFANKFINLPGGLAKAAVEVGKLREPSMLGTPLTIPTALDNMDASSPFLKTLASLPIAAGVHVDSIIAVKGTGPIEDGNDGVVEYKSAHIEGVESELVVRSGHSTQATPETIEEVRRILYEHAGIH